MAKKKVKEIVITEETKKYLKEKGYKISGSRNLEELIEKEKELLKTAKERAEKFIEKKMNTNISWLQDINEAKYYYEELKQLAQEVHDVIREVYSYEYIDDILKSIDDILTKKGAGIILRMYIGALLIMSVIKALYPKVDPKVTIISTDEDSERVKSLKEKLFKALDQGDADLVKEIIEELKAIIGDFRTERHNTIKELLTTMGKAKQKRLDSW